MQSHTLLGLAAALTLACGTAQAAKIELVVDYPYADVFNTVHAEIARRFNEKYRPPRNMNPPPSRRCAMPSPASGPTSPTRA